MRRTGWALVVLVACKGGSEKAGDPDIGTDPPDETDSVAVETDSPPAETEPPEETDTTPVELTEVIIEFVDPPSLVQLGRATDEVRFRVTAGDQAPEELTITWSSDVDGPLSAPTWDAAARGWAWSTAPLSAGAHVLTLVVTAPDGGTATATLDLGVCVWPAVEEFTAGIGADWQAYDAAAWDPSGWLEVTGNVRSSRGSIYKLTRKVNPGDLRMEFDIATGGGEYSGGDGYAVNIINVPDVTALEEYIGMTAFGGCLGYGVTLDCEVGSTISGFHIEFDTWYNNGDNAYDPTSSNHIGVMLDGDPSNHLLWADTFLEDLAWHHVVLEIRGTQVRVGIDGQLLIDGTIPGLSFDGGYVGISGSTGLATNFHRFDNLRIEDYCLVPEATP
jgi:hypothetical protein